MTDSKIDTKQVDTDKLLLLLTRHLEYLNTSKKDPKLHYQEVGQIRYLESFIIAFLDKACRPEYAMESDIEWEIRLAKMERQFNTN